MSTSTLIFVKLLFISLCCAQVLPSRLNFWNGNYYNQTMPGPPGTNIDLKFITFATDWFDVLTNQTMPVEINATYGITNLISQQQAVVNVSLYGYIGTEVGYITVSTPSLVPGLTPQFSNFCNQLSGTNVVSLCPFWATGHFMGSATGSILCHSAFPRCETMAVRFHYEETTSNFGGTTLAGNSGYPSYALIRGNARCPTTPVYQGQGGVSNTFFSPTSLQLYGIKFTANATGTVKRVFYSTNTPLLAMNFWLYADNTNTPVGGAVLGSVVFTRGNLGLSRQPYIGSDNYYSMEAASSTVTITSGSVYWLLGVVSGGNAAIPTVAGGCAATSSYTSTSAISSNLIPPLVGPAGTVSNNCYFAFVETC